MSERILEDLLESDEISYEKILSELLNTRDIELKSHISNPKGLAALNLLGSEILGGNGLEQSASFVSKFILWYLKYMVSKDRLGRIEIIKAVSNSRENERDFYNKVKEELS